MNFQDRLAEKTRLAEETIRRFLPEEAGFAASLAEAMNYSILSGGKRLRPVMMESAYRMFGGEEQVVGPFMAAMEMIHTFSLIHDDLPAIDNDDYRRGRLTTHRQFGEAMGVLAGDALLNYAYETMLGAFSLTEYPDRVASALQVMAEKTGIHGMLAGECVDVENDGKPVDCSTLDYIYENKTAALIEAALMTGAILAGAGEEQIRLIGEAGHYIGLSFQIRDDILDVTSTTEELGKPAHSDEKNNKVTYVTLMGIEQAEAETERLSQKAMELLASLPGDSSFLTELTSELIRRKY